MTIILIIAAFVGGVVTGHWVIPFVYKEETAAEKELASLKNDTKAAVDKAKTDINTVQKDVTDVKNKL